MGGIYESGLLPRELTWRTNLLSDVSYHGRIERQVISTINRGEVALESICRSCKGAFPSDVLSAIGRLGTPARIALVNELLPGAPDSHSLSRLFPEPHPVDFEWRFNEETALSVAKYVSGIGGRVACLGTPTVYRHLAAQGADSVLVDRNPFLPRYLSESSSNRVVTADLRFRASTCGIGKFDVIVLDAPWYLEYVKTWLLRALELANKGATIILTLFPELIHPSGRQERANLVRLLKCLGSSSNFTTGAVYETPLFETETLRALGLPPLPRWRTAELVVVRLSFPIPMFQVTPPKEDRWIRFLLGTQVVALRESGAVRRPLSIRPPYANGSFVLLSVSAGDPVRGHINLWSSRNRCMQVSGLETVREFLSALESGESTDSAIRAVANTQMESNALSKLIAVLDL